LIAPYGGRLINLFVNVDDYAACRERATFLPSIQISPRSLCDLELLSIGAFSPLDRFMGEKDYQSVLKEMRLSDGTLYPIPLTLPIENTANLEIGKEIVLRSPTNEMLAIMCVDEIYAWNREQESSAVLGTTDSRHPLVAEMHTWGKFYISGPLKVLSPPRYNDFLELRLTPEEVRKRLSSKGYGNVVAFQPRHAMHRAHETLTKKAADEVGGSLLIHPVVGMPKYGDRDHYTRVRCYKALVEHHYDPNKTLLSLIPLAVRMAGARAGLWHGIINRNYGANYFIIGRDPHSRGKDSHGKAFYDSAEVQKLFRKYEAEVGVQMIPMKEMVYVPKKNTYEESTQAVPVEKTLYRKVTRTRIVEDSLFNGQRLPEWFTRLEVACILHDENPPKTKRGFCIWLTGLPSSGKSTIAEALAPLLMARGKRVTFLDGDIVRTHLTKGLGFSKEDRMTNIARVGFVASEIIRHEGVVICALVSPFIAAREKVRAMIGEDRFIEVYVDTPIAMCEQRDVKGMYAQAKKGELTGFTGVDDAYEPPLTPEMRINTLTGTAQAGAESIIGFLTKNGFLAEEQGVQQTPKYADLENADELLGPGAPLRGGLFPEKGITPVFFQEESIIEKQKKNKIEASRNRPLPVLMTPLGHCGGHALQLRLNINPDFYAPYPLHIADFAPLVKLYGDLRDDKRYLQLTMDTIGLQTSSMVKWPDVVFDPVEIFESIKNEPRSIHRILWELLFQAGAKQGTRVVMDRSLDSIHYAAELTALFDDMLFLNVVRDPRSQIHSMNRAIMYDFDTVLNAMTWVGAHNIGKKLAIEHPNSVLTIRYEDFMSNQETVLRKICAFFDIEFLPAMLDNSRSRESQGKPVLSTEDLEIIETLAGEYMDYYGYERMTPGKAKITASMIAEAKIRCESKKKEAWANLEKDNNRDFQRRKFRVDYLEMIKNRLQHRSNTQESVAMDDVTVAWSNHIKTENGPPLC
jgi:sulfate adenylyltransferase